LLLRRILELGLVGCTACGQCCAAAVQLHMELRGLVKPNHLVVGEEGGEFDRTLGTRRQHHLEGQLQK
jgi:hypothetical protein